MPPFYFLTFAKVSVSVSKKFGLKKVSVSVSKTFGLEKKSRYWSQKHLVSKKVSVLVSNEISGLVTQCLEHVHNIIILTLTTTIMLTWAVGVHHRHGLWSNFCTTGPRLQMLPIYVSVKSFSATNWTHFRCYPWESSQTELPFTSCKRRCIILILHTYKSPLFIWKYIRLDYIHFWYVHNIFYKKKCLTDK